MEEFIVMAVVLCTAWLAQAQSPYYYNRPDYAFTGAALGGIAGGIIGHNHHRQSAEGAAIGVGAGLLLGSIAEYHARRREASYAGSVPVYYYPAVTYAPPQAPPPQPPPQPPPVAPPVSVNSMSSANSLFGR
jgi:hypothetical protein